MVSLLVAWWVSVICGWPRSSDWWALA